MAQEVAEQAARRYSRNAAAAVAIDSLLQNSGRREHDYATWRIRHLVAGLRIAADRLVFLDFSRHSYVSLQFHKAPIAGKCACDKLRWWLTWES